MHLRPHRRVQAVRADQQLGANLRLRSVRGANQHRDAIGLVAIACHAVPREHRAGTEALERRAVQQHLQSAAMHRVLRPAVSREEAARLGVHVLAVQPDERPLPGLQPDRVELVGTQPKLVELAHRVRLEVDPHAERLQIRDGFEHQTRHADLLQGKGDAESADSATGDEYGQVGHRNSLSPELLRPTRIPDSRAPRKTRALL